MDRKLLSKLEKMINAINECNGCINEYQVNLKELKEIEDEIFYIKENFANE